MKRIQVSMGGIFFLCQSLLMVAGDVSLMRVPNGGIQPQAQIGQDGKLHLVYYLGEPVNGDLYYVNRASLDTNWSNPVRINHHPKAAVSGGTIRGAQMCLGKDDRVHVAWFGSGEIAGKFSDEPKPHTPLLVTRQSDDGMSFETERNLMTWTSALDGGGSITTDQKGRVWVAWHARGASELDGEMGRNIFLSVSEDEGQTFTRERKVKEAPQGACSCCGMRIHHVSPNNLHIAYRGLQDKKRPMIDLWSDDGGITFQYTAFDPWEIEACPMSSVSLLNVTEGGVLIANELKGKIHLNLNAPGSNRVIPMQVGSENWKGKHPSMAFDTQGNTLLSWASGAGWAKGGELRWVLIDADRQQIHSMDPTELHQIPTWSFPCTVFFDREFHILY